MTICRCIGLLLTFAALGGCDESSRTGRVSNISQPFVLAERTFSGETFRQWRLPTQLREISGLALTDDQRLFAHGDEVAVLFELDYADGAISKSFSLGNPPLRGDFEGLAYVENLFYLVTSTGRIYVAEEGDDGSYVQPWSFETDVGKSCEVEGLSYDPLAGVLLLACKLEYDRTSRGIITVQRWSIGGQELVDPIRVQLAGVLEKTGGSRFNPSGIEWVKPDRLLLVAARQRSILEIDLEGQVISAFKLPLASFHRQTEGIAFDGVGQLILADEGGNQRGRLGVYRPAG